MGASPVHRDVADIGSIQPPRCGTLCEVDPTSLHDVESPLGYLRSTTAIRERTVAVLRAGIDGSLTHFEVHPERLAAVVARVRRAALTRHPDWAIRWPSRLARLRIGGVDRLRPLAERYAGDPSEHARVLVELAILSILLGAGAGPRWRFVERGTGIALGRTEGLALASLHAYSSGLLSSDPANPYRIDADAVDDLAPSTLARAIDVRPDNPMPGIEERVDLIAQLGSAMRAAPHMFGKKPRLGGLYDALCARAVRGRLPARRILATLLDALAPFWPSEHTLLGVNLGDVWPHPAAGGVDASAGLVPFHTIAQWMAYSIVPVLQASGIEVEAPDGLTALTEVRTAGLFVDDGVLVPRDPGVLCRPFAVGDPLIVEWRALSIALVDHVAETLRLEAFPELDPAARRTRLPVALVIEGGTWAAGREAARERRRDGSPPFDVQVRGAIF